MKLLEYLKNDFLKVNNIDLRCKKVVVCVSTGIDSMVLLDCFLKLREEIDFEVICCHVNHNKRKQSIEEEKYISSFCSLNNIKIYVKSIDFSKNKENFQKKAREERYKFFYEVLNEENAQYLALAHHGNDNMETILMRLIRGSSLSAYGGIKEVTVVNQKTIIRPFIKISKEEIIDHQKEYNIKYYSDESNDEDLYTRNRIRKEIIPLLFKENKDVNKKFYEFSLCLTKASLELDNLRDNFIATKIKNEEKSLTFQKKDFLELSDYMQEEVLFAILKSYNLGKNNINELLKLINSSKANLSVLYKKDLTFVKEYEKISFFFEKIENSDTYIVIDEVKEYFVSDTISINVIKKSDNYVTNLNSLWYNTNKLPIVVRKRKNADKIKLSSGYKKVKDLLIDKKVGILERNNVLVVEDKNKEIIWVIGYSKSEALKLEKDNNILITFKERKNG